MKDIVESTKTTQKHLSLYIYAHICNNDFDVEYCSI